MSKVKTMEEVKAVKQTDKTAGGYLAPGVKVHEVKVRAVLCGSTLGAGNDGYDQVNYEW